MRLVLPVLLLGLVASAAAAPRPCGSDVDGQGTAVPCRCGDLLVSSHVLSDADPVTRETCVGPGLVVTIPTTRAGATLALGGQTLRGAGVGAGIALVSGGRDGLLVSGPGAIRGFDTGVLAPRAQLRRLADVVLADNRHDGAQVRGTGYGVQGCVATTNGRDGLALRGSGFVVTGNRAERNGRFGFSVSGKQAQFGSDNVADGNRRTDADLPRARTSMPRASHARPAPRRCPGGHRCR